jgi:hypothetical protein
MYRVYVPTLPLAVTTHRKGRKLNVANLASMPWNRWSRRGALLFEDDLTIKPRTKLNNQGAHAMGVKLSNLAENETDVKLRQRFLTLSCEAFSREISNNPSSPITLRYLATNLFYLEALECGVTKVKTRGCMPSETYWNASCRYIEFLYAFSLSADKESSRSLRDYAVFLGAFGLPAMKSACMLCQSLVLAKTCSEEETTAELLLETLQAMRRGGGGWSLYAKCAETNQANQANQLFLLCNITSLLLRDVLRGSWLAWCCRLLTAFLSFQDLGLEDESLLLSGWMRFGR